MTSSASLSADGGPFTAFLRLIRFTHTLFALPYAVAGFMLGLREAPASGRRLLWTAAFALAAIVCARTAAMVFNRLVDRRFDATNPRTRTRGSVTGQVSARQMAAITLLAAAGFVISAFALNALCGVLSFVALAVILGYSYTKRVTALSHFVLGAALGLAPVGAYLAATGAFGASAPGVWLLSAAVVFWTAGFDILYACQDVDHDRAEGLHSVPVALGIPRALGVARVCHALVLVFLLLSARALGLGIVFSGGIVAVGFLLALEHSLVRPGDLSRIQTAFFQLNVLVSVVVMASVVADLWMK